MKRLSCFSNQYAKKNYRINFNGKEVNASYMPPLTNIKHPVNLDELILPEIVEAKLYESICSNCGWHNSINDLAYFCPKCGKDLNCGHLKETQKE